jgi:acyl carrier protein
MSSTTIHARLERVVRTLFNDDEIVLSDETTAGDVPGWDSLANINLLFAIEQEFGVALDPEEFGGFANIGELKQRLEESGVG